jgi:hypothetical protein
MLWYVAANEALEFKALCGVTAQGFEDTVILELSIE